MGKTIQLSGFPSQVTADAVKEFLEVHTGNGTVYALKIRLQKQRPRRRACAFAIVQFTTSTSAELITSLVNRPQRLSYGGYFLKVWVVGCDIVPKPRPSIFTLEHTKLHFGCQVSGDQFSVLWSAQDVAVNFGFELRKIYFFLSYGGVQYKLELSYEVIWEIQLRRPHGQNRCKFLLIQVLGVPMIYEKAVCSSGLSYKVPVLNYFMDASNDQWDRATDFTHSFCIGQSSAMCLELSYSCELLDFKEHFVYYKEDEGQFILKSGSAFSRNLDLVPIVGPPDVPELQRFPYNILFKVCSLVQNGCLAGPTLDANFFKLVHPAHNPVKYIEHALDELYDLQECCYDPVKWLLEQYERYRKSNRQPKSPISSGTGLVYVRRVQITPSKVYFYGPEVNVSNRVLRNYSNYIDNFIRVSFVDEDFDKMYSTDLSPRTSSASEERRTGIYKRILSTLRNGLVIGEKRFDFLAFSSSQLRDNSAWMFAKTDDGLTAEKIRDWMGDFRGIRNVAKYAARLGQSFSSSTATLNVSKHEFEIIRDIELERGRMKYVFSDGIGKISADFARRVAKKCGLTSSTPSAFQIRYGGYKGVVAVDPTSTMKLSLRKSMCKYESQNTKLDVLAWSKYQPCFLNRQIITLLSTLGVRDHIFQEKQRHVVDKLDVILTDPLKALEALEQMSPGENSNVLKEMLMCGYEPDAEPFLSMMLQTFRAAKLHELRTKTRIFVPNGRSLMGCLDETGTLEYGQVFVQVSSIWRMFGGNESDQQKIIVKGNVTVAKNPCLHPGDVRVLQAIDVPALNHMVNCIVFPQKGARPHPNECSGSDLDGDIYFVSWDPALIPPRQIQPMEYVPAETISLDHDVTIEQVEEYFTNYIVNESLGIIANAHTVLADKEPEKAESKNCMELARLFSIAVDFPKTGVPAEIPDHLYVREYPDFMEKLDKPTYESRRVIGKLYREIKFKASHTSFTKFTQEVARRSYDPDMEVDGFEDYIDDAYYYKGEYDSELGNLMNFYGIKTEAQILSESTTKIAKSFSKKCDPDAMGLAVRSLKKKARRWFDKGLESGSPPDEVYAKASAWYHVTYHPSHWGCYKEGRNRDHYLSFPWCVYDKLVKIKKDKSSIRRSLERNFADGLRLD
ncbi:probable RNA-dependent RNA polymerase 1 [Telopea speciosissima]|uniref:probable RNA-dependent RNA polymerase 1 n=1 Tax=Telopea speciosissima TaxID=54955 RepID=UPI001CC37526|nr:probable RNA-dependent RNA polymerase 1 [Telopea speciosissima]XP_043704235.1 probable RNA-dependent RNA polymerase 1 [Telopea speciosissima]XP_043704236.1 probable RNA-dependent RNA polymerase 1 [Telopea speciosissima]XP_043704237.1 probable RNA-dependent RNA polymerase 1 [Telopea speciosissima]